MSGKSRLLLGSLVVLVVGASGPVAGQTEPVVTQTPSGVDRMSQPARVTQRMGSTEVTVVYNRPVARGRDLFGGLVPWDSIWNPGADEATRIELNEDLSIAGETLPAGRYSIWAIPRPEEWTLVFSRAWDVQHRPYPEGNDALRIRVTPSSAPHMESLAIYFPLAEADSALLALHWGQTVIRIPLRKP
jgi:hypothetical protein